MNRVNGQQRDHDSNGSRSRLVRRWTIACLLITAVQLPAVSQDRAVIQQPGGSRFPITGFVNDFTGTQLIISLRAGEVPRRYLRDDVVEIQTAYTPHHEKGRRLLAEGRIAEAKAELSAALNEEDRRWIRREILALLTRCALWNGDYRAAVSSFVPIIETDPETIHYGVAPLAWSVGAATDEIKVDARTWIQEKTLIFKLIGASHLLFDRDMNDEAETVLRRLSRDPSFKLQRMATMQLWRVRSANGTTTPAELNRWETSIEESPEELRSGGYFVLGETYRRLQEPERAAAALLWLPLVYDSDRHLAARACYEAAEQIESFGDTAQATNLYGEVIFRYGDTPFGAKAEARWQALRKNGPKE